MRRTVIAAHVLSEPERERYSRLYDFPIDRLHFIPFPLFRQTYRPAEEGPAIGGVVVSGRAVCDWELVFAAADGADWPLTVICSEKDAARVGGLNRDNRATLHVEVPPQEHDRLVNRADVYVLAVREEATSAGHVRLRSAIENGTPVVATAISGLTGYLEPGAIRSVPPRDPRALRAAIDELLAHPEERERMAAAARAWAAGERSFEHYLSSMRKMFRALLDRTA
jgi:glycosyltransferase involved in cell wall biosynthesis